MSSSQSCPVLPTSDWPHAAQSAVGPIAIEAALPC